MKKHQRGFTLIELMIVVAVIGIIASLAYSSYMNAVMRSNRTEAKTDLMDVAQRLQKCFTTYGRYNDPDGDNLCPVYEDLTDGTDITTRGRGFYEISIDNDTATTYRLTATAVAGMTQANDAGCETMTLDQMGQTLPADCW